MVGGVALVDEPLSMKEGTPEKGSKKGKAKSSSSVLVEALIAVGLC